MEGNTGQKPSLTRQGPLKASGRNYSGAGIKTSVPGTVYQIELLMLFINRGLRARCTFSVATEVASAGAFDDLVFEYETATTNGILFLQAKHRTNLDKKIREIDLTDVGNGDFSILKYFESYRKIITKKKKEFKGDMKQFVIYAPINIDDDVLDNFEEVPPSREFAEDGFLYFDPNELPRVPKFLKFRKNSSLYKKLIELLENNIERSIVAAKLGKSIANNNAITVEEVFKKHRDWLLEKVLNADNIKTINNKVYIRFKGTFLKTTDADDVEVAEFRKVFLQSYLETRNKQVEKKENETFESNNKQNEPTESEEIQIMIDVLTEENATFQVAKTFLTSKFKKFKADAVDIEEIESYFDKLVLATNQPNDEELKHIIRKEIGKSMSLMMDKSEWVESRLQSCVLDWLKTKEGRFLTNEDCVAFFDYVKQEFASWGQTSLSLAHVSHIENCGYTFEINGHLMGTVTNFLSDDGDMQILCVWYTNRLLTQIKLWQTRSCNHDFIFGELKKLSRQVGSKMCPIKALTSRSNNHVFLEIDNCSDLKQDEVNLLQKIMQIVENDTKKRLVVIVPKDQLNNCCHILQNCVAHLEKHRNYQILQDLQNNFSDLSEESKEKFLRTASVRFQGRKFLLSTLLDTTLMDRLGGDMLCKLINDDMDIESAPADVLYNTVKAYYIERTLSRCKFLKEEIVCQLEFHIIYDLIDDDNQDGTVTVNPMMQVVKYNSQNDNLDNTTKTDKKNILVITKNNDLFTKVCQKYGDRNVHWLVKGDNFYVWQESQGSIFELRKWLNMKWKEYWKPCDAVCEQVPNKIVIVNAVPGMGKSIVLSHLETNTKSEYFCIRSNLVDHWGDFDDLDEDDMTKESIKFLYKAIRLVSEDYKDDIYKHIAVLENGDLKLNAGPGTTFDELLRISIFCHIYNEGNIVLFLDAFDEISPQYNEKVIRLIQTLKFMKVSKMWITTRPYDLVNELEDKLSVFSYILEPLSVDEQRYLLLYYWKTKLKVEICETKIIAFLHFLERTVFKHLNRDDVNYMSTFMGIPLHIIMLTTIEQKRFLEFHTKTTDVDDEEEDIQFSIYSIYNEFFKIKFEDILYKETDLDAPKYRSIFRDKKRKTMKDHGKLALLHLFGDVPESLVCEDEREKLKEEVMIGEEKTGIVYKFADGKPRFVHRTFAEFFAARLLADTILNSKGNKAKVATKFLYKIITEYTWQSSTIFLFFNYEVVSNSKYYSPLFNTALNGNVQKVIEVENIAEIRDDLGRTPFHLLFCSGLVYSEAIDIFQNYGNAMLVSDNLFKWSPLHYAVLFHECDKTLLYKGHKFVTKSPEPQFRDINGRTPLILASQRKCTKRCIFNFIYNFSLEIDAQDNTGKTALHYALCNVKESQQNLESLYDHDFSAFDVIGFYNEHISDNEGEISVNHFNVDQLSTLRKKLLTDPELCSMYHTTSPNLSLLATEIVDTWNAQVNTQDCEGKTALHYAIGEKKWMEVHVLIRQNADVTIKDNKGRMPAYFEESEVMNCEVHESTLFFINSLKPDVMKLLVDNMELSQDVLVQILYRYKNITEYLLPKGLLSANMQDSTGKTGLHHAVIQNNGDGILFLKKLNADPNIKDNDKNMPLQYITTGTNVEVVIINLLMMGAYFDVVSQEILETISVIKSAADLFDSVKNNNLEKVRSVLTSEFSGVLVKVRTKEGGRTALHLAARAGYTDIGRSLLLHGGCYNVRDDNEITPGQLAQRHNHLAMHDSILTPRSLADIVRKTPLNSLQITKSREIHRTPFDCDCYECKLRDVAVHYMDKSKRKHSNQKVTLELQKSGNCRTLQYTTESVTQYVTRLEFLVRRCRGRDLMVMLRSRDLNNDTKILAAGKSGMTEVVLPMLNRCYCQSDDEHSCTCISQPLNMIVIVVVIVVYIRKQVETLHIDEAK